MSVTMFIRWQNHHHHHHHHHHHVCLIKTMTKRIVTIDNKKDGYRQRNVRQFLQSASGALFGYLIWLRWYVIIRPIIVFVHEINVILQVNLQEGWLPPTKRASAAKIN